MVKIKVDIGDLARLQASLLDDSALRDLPGRLAETTERQTQERFGRRREPSGKPWEARRRKAGHPLLEKTGRLRGSIEAAGESGGNPGVELRATVPYGQIIQSKRPFLGWGRRDQKELAAEAEQQFLARLATGALR